MKKTVDFTRSQKWLLEAITEIIIVVFMFKTRHKKKLGTAQKKRIKKEKITSTTTNTEQTETTKNGSHEYASQ